MTAKIHAIRGATTASANTVAAMRSAVKELLDTIELYNQLKPENIISVIFTVTRDLDAIFPAAIAREKPNWDQIPLLDLQQMHVQNSLERCIRVLLYVTSPNPQPKIVHVYLQQAKTLRPDINLEGLISETFPTQL